MHKKNFLELIRISVGLALLCTGIMVVVLPLLQGWLLVLIAIPLISPKHGKMMMARLKGWIAKCKKHWHNKRGT